MGHGAPVKTPSPQPPHREQTRPRTEPWQTPIQSPRELRSQVGVEPADPARSKGRIPRVADGRSPQHSGEAAAKGLAKMREQGIKHLEPEPPIRFKQGDLGAVAQAQALAEVFVDPPGLGRRAADETACSPPAGWHRQRRLSVSTTAPLRIKTGQRSSPLPAERFPRHQHRDHKVNTASSSAAKPRADSRAVQNR